VVGAAETAREGLRLAATLRPDVVLLDLKLPDADQFDGVASFAREGRSIVVFTRLRLGRGCVPCDSAAGRAATCSRDRPAADIAQAVRQTHAGESYLSPRIAAKLVKGVTEPRRRAGLLSGRERGVLRLVAAGAVQPADCRDAEDRGANGQVSRDRHLQQARRDNRAQAVAIAAERGLLTGR
jgi:DNA-binding NarL/FixJ family response regulator